MSLLRYLEAEVPLLPLGHALLPSVAAVVGAAVVAAVVLGPWAPCPAVVDVAGVGAVSVS